MKTIFCLLFMVFTLSGVNTLSLMAQNSYQTDLLADMAESLKLANQLNTLEDGRHCTEFFYKKRPLNVTVENGRVSHIGYLFFSKEQRRLMQVSAVYNFLERYVLALDLPLKREKPVEKQLAEDNINFTVGEMSDLRKQVGDTTLNLKIENLSDRRYKISWYREDKLTCSVDFPISYDLLHGTEMVENERRIVEAIKRAASLPADTTKINPKSLVMTWQPNYFVLPGDTCYTAELSTTRYYEKSGDGKYQLLFNRQHPLESLANLLTTVNLKSDFRINVRLRKYDAPDENFEVPLLQFISYFLRQGCTPYFGVISFEGTLAVCELLMRNANEGYCHVMKVTCDVEQLLDKKGNITARLTSYVPTFKIKNLFKEDEY